MSSTSLARPDRRAYKSSPKNILKELPPVMKDLILGMLQDPK
jgi:hypothetical protein